MKKKVKSEKQDRFKNPRLSHFHHQPLTLTGNEERRGEERREEERRGEERRGEERRGEERGALTGLFLASS